MYDFQPRNVPSRGLAARMTTSISPEVIAFLLEKDWPPGPDFSKKEAIVSQRLLMSSNAPDSNRYVQYEVAIPFEKAGLCAREVYDKSQEVYSEKNNSSFA